MGEVNILFGFSKKTPKKCIFEILTSEKSYAHAMLTHCSYVVACSSPVLHHQNSMPNRDRSRGRRMGRGDPRLELQTDERRAAQYDR